MDLTNHEAELVDDLQRRELKARKSLLPVRADVLRSLILGIPVRLPGETHPRKIQIPQWGVHLAHLSVNGELDLSHAAHPDGKALCPIKFEECVFLAPIRLDGANLSELSLMDSQVRHIEATGTTVNGSVNLSRICPLSRENPETRKFDFGPCSANFSSATIKGDFVAFGAVFSPSTGHPPLELSLASIGGNCLLDSQTAGSQTAKVFYRFIAIGGIEASLTQIGGMMTLRGAYVGGHLNLENARIAGGLYLGPVLNDSADRSELVSFESHGTLHFMSLRIGGRLSIDGASLDPKGELALNLSNAEIGEMLYLGHGPFPPIKNVDPTRLKIRGGVLVVATRVKWFFKAEGVDLNFDSENSEGSTGAPNNAGRQVAPLTIAACELYQVDFSDVVASAISFQSSKVTLTCDINDIKVDSLDLTDAVIATDLTLDGLSFRAPPTSATTREKGESRQQLSLNGTTVGSTLILRNLDWISKETDDDKVVVDLRACRTRYLDDEEDAENWGPSTLIRTADLRYEAAPERTTQGHLKWLSLQYKGPKPEDDEFIPSSYNYLSKALREEGYEEEADRVLSAKLTIEQLKLSRFGRWKRSLPKSGPIRVLYFFQLLFLGPYWFLRFMFWWLFRLFFDYGLSQVRTVCTFVTLVLLGWAGAHVADYGFKALHIKPVLVVQANPVNTVAVPAPGGNDSEPITTGFPVGQGL
jgi:hypothetical protein